MFLADALRLQLRSRLLFLPPRGEVESLGRLNAALAGLLLGEREGLGERLYERVDRLLPRF